MISSDNLALNNSTNDEDFTYAKYRELLKMAKSGWKISDYRNIEWDEKSNSWEFKENEHISDNAIWLKETSNPKDCLETVFSQLDFYEHLYENEITSAAFMEQLPDDYKPYYKPYHDEFVAKGDFQ